MMKLPSLPNDNLVFTETKHGLMLVLVKDLFVSKSLIEYGQWCQQELDVMAKWVWPGAVVVDVGAFIGSHSVGFAEMVGPTGLVVSLEPQQIIYELLCANAVINAMVQINPIRAWAGAKAGIGQKIPLLDWSQPQNFGGLPVSGQTVGETVKSITIDALKLSECHLIKIDVEGMEADVITGARKTIATHRPILYVENNREENSARLWQLINELDYDIYWHIFDYFDKNNYKHNPKNVFKNIYPEANVICFPKELAIAMPTLIKTEPQQNWKHVWGVIAK